MKATRILFGVLLGASLSIGGATMAQGNGNGNGHGKGNGNGHGKHGNDDAGVYYQTHQQKMMTWYSGVQSNLPPGLAKKDHLPPGLEKQLVRNGTLPPGLQKKIYPAPVELQRCLPPPPPDCANMVVGGRVVLLNQKTNLIVDIFAF